MGEEKKFLLAIEGDGSKTRALLTDLEGNVLARGLGPGSDVHLMGFPQFCEALTTAIDGALGQVFGKSTDQQGWRTAKIAAACFGLAGVDRPEDEREISRWVRDQNIAPLFRVLNDSELILAAGTPDGWGVALISGTGSVCLGRSPEGKTARVGGWGHVLGDEGSGYQMGIRALSLATQTADGRADARDLLATVLRHWSLSDAQELIRYAHAPTTTQAEIAGLAAEVANLAAKGDAAAQRILDEAAGELARHVDAIVQRLRLRRPPLALAGAAMRGNLRNAVRSAIRSEIGPLVHVSDPSLGAIALAQALLKGSPRGG
jgi:N-acetylglucosamine kinase-like BadF-type ATPase